MAKHHHWLLITICLLSFNSRCEHFICSQTRSEPLNYKLEVITGWGGHTVTLTMPDGLKKTWRAFNKYDSTNGRDTVLAYEHLVHIYYNKLYGEFNNISAHFMLTENRTTSAFLSLKWDKCKDEDGMIGINSNK